MRVSTNRKLPVFPYVDGFADINVNQYYIIVIWTRLHS